MLTNTAQCITGVGTIRRGCTTATTGIAGVGGGAVPGIPGTDPRSRGSEIPGRGLTIVKVRVADSFHAPCVVPQTSYGCTFHYVFYVTLAVDRALKERRSMAIILE